MDTSSDDHERLAAEHAYLASLRERIEWHAEAADRLRQGLPPVADNVVPFRERSADEGLADDAQAGPPECA